MNDAFGRPQMVLILGGASDIGMAFARATVVRGTSTVILAGRNLEALSRNAGDLRSLGATKVAAEPFDALDTPSHPAFIDRVFDEYGDVDVALIAFGILVEQADLERDPALAVELIQTNFTGAASVCLAVAQRMRRQAHGKIVVLSSVAGERVRKSNFIYGASKAAIDGLAQGLTFALDGSGAGAMIVRPGFVSTKMTAGRKPLPFAVSAEVVAEAMIKGLNSGKELIWVPPILRLVMALVRHLPRAVFRRMDL